MTSDLTTTPEQDHCRNAANAIAARDRLLGVRVELTEPDCRLELTCGGGESGCHLAARAAPGCPEIDKQWNAGTGGVRIEVGCGQINRRFRQTARYGTFHICRRLQAFRAGRDWMPRNWGMR